MKAKELKENLTRRITNLSQIEYLTTQSEFGKGYDIGYRQACLQILEMIKGYK